jgi:uncharacterized protein YdeI (BOF family)
MNKLMLPVMGTLLLCAQSFSVLAATSTSASAADNNGQQLREQIEAKRDQISGVANVSKTTVTGAASMQDTPVVTDDAPAQVQQK